MLKGEHRLEEKASSLGLSHAKHVLLNTDLFLCWLSIKSFSFNGTRWLIWGQDFTIFLPSNKLSIKLLLDLAPCCYVVSQIESWVQQKKTTFAFIPTPFDHEQVNRNPGMKELEMETNCIPRTWSQWQKGIYISNFSQKLCCQ